MIGEPETADDWIAHLDLEAHPEGGFFRETWRSGLELPASALPHAAPRAAGTAILFLLRAGERSSWHRVGSDELWIHQRGNVAALSIASRPDESAADTVALGAGGVLQALVPAGRWQTTRAALGGVGYAIFCCVVVPGFDFADFELLGDS